MPDRTFDPPNTVYCWCVPVGTAYVMSNEDQPCTWPECPNAKMPDPESFEPAKLWRPPGIDRA